MEKCPPEVLHHIFQLICNDGGQMARSLSLVSKYIRDASKGVRFQTVICRNAAQINGFASTLEKTPPHHRIIRHLFVSCSSRDVPTSQIKGSPIPRTTRGFRNKSQFSPLPVTHLVADTVVTFGLLMDTYRSALSAITRIVHMAAPTLKSLSLHIDWPSSEVFLPSHLPAIVELSISRPWARWHLPSEALHGLVSCPRLRRLVLSGFVNIHEPTGLTGYIQRIAPSLTHLCFPFDPAMQVVNAWKTVMDESVASDDAVFPRTLELFLLHHKQVMDMKWSGDPRIAVIGRSWIHPRGGEPLEKQWENLWMDGINGGDGFWSRMKRKKNLGS